MFFVHYYEPVFVLNITFKQHEDVRKLFGKVTNK